MKEFIEQLRVKHFENKMKKMKPRLLASWRASLEEELNKQYDETIEKLESTIIRLEKEKKEIVQSRDYFKGKYEGVKEAQEQVQDKLLTTVQHESTNKGQLKEQIKQLKEENK